MEASNQRLTEVHIVDFVKITVRDDKEYAALDILDIKSEANLQQRCVDLLTTYIILVCHVCEFFEDLLHGANMLVEYVTDISCCLADSVSFSTFIRLQCDTFVVSSVWPGVNWWLTLHHFVRAVWIKHCVAELVVGDLTVLSCVKVTHQDQNLIICQHEAKLLQGLPELLQCDNTIVVSIKATEDVAHQWELLSQTLPKLLEHCLQVNLGSFTILSNVLPCVLIHV